MKRLWLVYVIIGTIFLVNFLYVNAVKKFEEEISTLTENAYLLADTDYRACGECIEKISKKIRDETVLLYAFTNKGKIENIEKSVQSAIEYYNLMDKEKVKYNLYMVKYQTEELKEDEMFTVKNLL